MASKRVQLTITAQRFFDDAQNKREAVRVWSLPWKLPYWIEKWDAQNEQAKVWVKVPKIPAGGSVDLYVYYGNPTAQSESSGDEVFEFFDDFKDYTQNWNIDVGSATQESNTEVKAWGGWQTSGLISKMTFNAGVIVEAKVKSPQNGGTGVGQKNANGGYVAFCTRGSAYSDPRARIVTGTSSVTIRASASFSEDITAYHVQGYAFTTDKRFIGLWEGQEIVEWDASGYPSYNGDTFYITLQSYNYDATSGTDYHYYDWVRVRKYADQEPSISVGSEESSDVSGWLYRRKITITNPNSYDLYHFQVAIDLDSSNFDFSKANSDGSDIRVTYGEGRYELSYYIDTWDTSTPQAVIWVGIDSETKFYIELNPNNTTDESDSSVMNLPEATNYTLNKFEKYT